MDVRALVAGTAVLASLAGGGGWLTGQALAGGDGSPAAAVRPTQSATRTATPTATPTGPPTRQAVLARAKAATVRLEPDNGSYFGSGTVISATGLVLTNAHVAVPQAPGLAFHYQETGFEPDPAYLTVSLNPADDGPAVARYRATPLVADGYLDLAVLQIDALADGSPLPAGQVFPFVPVAPVDRVATGDHLTVLGYPAVAGGGGSLSVTEGEVATFVTDPRRRVKASRWEIDTSARIAGGNSGGAAVSDEGLLIGVPSAATRSGEYSGRIRPVALAAPLLAAVARGTQRSYRTPYDVVGTGREALSPLGWTLDGEPCEATELFLEAYVESVSGAVRLTGMTAGEDVLVDFAEVGAEEPIEREVFTWSGGTSACLARTYPAPRAAGFSPGDYELRVHVGPQLRALPPLPLTLGESGD